MAALMRRVTYCQLVRRRTLCNPLVYSPRASSTATPTNNNDATHDDENELHSDEPNNVLYPGHIPTTTFQKSMLAFGSGIACILNPARDDMICALGETTGTSALKYMQRKMLSHPVGRQILEEKPQLNTTTIDVNYLGSLPEGTFGKEYWHFLDKNGFSPDARRPVNFIDDTDLMYVMLRYRQCHDLFHTLLGMPPNMLGEVAVKWFEAIQTRLPMCVSAALFGPIRLGPKHRQKYRNIYRPWAIRSARNADFLMNVYFEKHWEQSLEDMRKELNVEPSPVPLIKTGKNTKTK